MPNNEPSIINILYVEDKFVNQKIAELIIKDLGCNVEIANNGVEALAKYTPNKYNLILMDICMPVMDGIQTFKELTKKYNSSLPPIIAVTASATEDDANDFIELGMNDFVPKPITRDKIVQVLIDHLYQEP